MKNENTKIVVYGGTGHYGSRTVKSLLTKNVHVRVVSRNREKALKMFDNKVDIFEGDITNLKNITDSLKDMQAMVICLSAMNKSQIRNMKQIERDAVLNIMEEAGKLGVSRLVYMSGYEIKEPLQLLQDLNAMEIGEIKLEIENKIKQSSFNWTILGDSPSFEIFFAFLRKGKILAVPGGGYMQIPCISATDVGEIAAQAAMRNDLGGQRFKMTGPKAYSFPEVAVIMAELAGKKIKHVKIPLSIFAFISFVTYPFNPFVRYIYKSLKMLNNFPKEFAEQVPSEHQRLRETYNYEPITLEMEILKRMKE